MILIEWKIYSSTWILCRRFMVSGCKKRHLYILFVFKEDAEVGTILTKYIKLKLGPLVSCWVPVQVMVSPWQRAALES